METHQCGPKRSGFWRQGQMLLALLVFSGSAVAVSSYVDRVGKSGVRLTGGASAHSGRVDLLRNGRWQPVCSDGFGANEAHAVCRQLKLPTTGSATYSKPISGPMKLKIDLPLLQCRDDEVSLASCNVTFSSRSCESARAAGVRCGAAHPSPKPQGRQPLPLSSYLHFSTRRGRPGGPRKASLPPPRRAPSPRRHPISSPPPRRSPPPPSLPSPSPVSRPPPLPPSPPPLPTVCSVRLVGWGAAGITVRTVRTATVACTGGNGGPVNVTVGAQLLSFAMGWSGVYVSERPGDQEWGVTFNDVPYMQLRDSIVTDLPYSRGPLLQCANCDKVELSNVTVSFLRAPSKTTSLPLQHGPLHFTNVSYVLLQSLSCSSCRGGYGWSCVLLQYRGCRTDAGPTAHGSSSCASAPPARLDVVNSTFNSNNVTRAGLYGIEYAVPTKSQDPNGSGYGAVVVTTVDMGHGSQHSDGVRSGVELVVSMTAVQARGNRGGSGAFFSAFNMSKVSVDLVGCTFVSNTATQGDGAVFSINGPVGSFTMRENTIFTQNQAQRGSGGALYFSDHVAHLQVTNSSMTFNWAGQRGGAIACLGGLGELVLQRGSALKGNFAGAEGGAVWVGAGDVGAIRVLEGSEVAGNTAYVTRGFEAARRAVTDVHTTLKQHADKRCCQEHDDVDGVSVSTREGKNSSRPYSDGGEGGDALNGYGGALAVYGNVMTVELGDGGAVYDNSANKDGGALWVSGTIGSVRMATGSRVCGNSAVKGSGGALFAAGGAGELVLSGGSVAEDNMAALHGGFALLGGTATNSIVLEEGCALQNNTATAGNGGGICVMYTLATIGLSVQITAAIVRGNSAGRLGGALYLGPREAAANTSNVPRMPLVDDRKGDHAPTASLWQLRIAGSNLSNNAAGRAGGAVFVSATSKSGVSFWMNNSTLFGNRASNDSKVADAQVTTATATAGGGAIVLVGDSDSLPPAVAGGDDDCASAVGTAEGTGFKPSTLHTEGSCTAEIRNTEFVDSITDGSGGAVLLTFCTALIENSQFINNSAAASGGAVAAEALPPKEATFLLPASDLWRALVVRHSRFEGNIAKAGPGGALVTTTAGVVRMCSCEFMGNSAPAAGGGAVAVLPASTSALEGAADPFGTIVNASSLELDSSTLIENVGGTIGGAVFAASLADVRVQGCVISRNRAVSGGGIGIALPVAAAADTGTVTTEVKVEYTSFTSNSALNIGGAFYVDSRATSRLTDCPFVGNQAQWYGGAVAAIMKPFKCGSSGGGGTGGDSFITTVRLQRSLMERNEVMGSTLETSSTYAHGAAKIVVENPLGGPDTEIRSCDESRRRS